MAPLIDSPPEEKHVFNVLAHASVSLEGGVQAFVYVFGMVYVTEADINRCLQTTLLITCGSLADDGIDDITILQVHFDKIDPAFITKKGREDMKDLRAKITRYSASEE